MTHTHDETRPTAAPKRGGRAVPKGRDHDPDALAAVRALLGDRPRRRDMLIEHLHLIQDRLGWIPHAWLAALADEMRLSMAEVFEVATFYAHFDVRETAPEGRLVRVCDGIACALAGAEALAEAVARLPGVRLHKVPCIGSCDAAPAAAIGHAALGRATLPALLAALDGAAMARPAPVSLAATRAAGGYETLRRLRDGDLSAESVLDALDRSRLAGLGGAGFPTGRKWRTLRAAPGPRLMVVNADEGEPGTFKDRFLMETDPHRLLEGCLIAAEVIDAESVIIYVRDEYPDARHILADAIAELDDPRPITLRRGAGAYICGEETALIESIEGKRGLPRHKPPFIFQEGLFGRPTLANNVETLWWVRDILTQGADWWTAQGRHGCHGLRCYSVSGRVREPGVKIAPAGITARELIAEFCGGMADGHIFHAYLPGGASGGILPEALADEPLHFGTLEKHGSFIGSAAVVVLSDQDDLREVARNLMRFFRDESCGQCTPCRAGTAKAVTLMNGAAWDEPLLRDLSQAMRDASICGLGQAAPNPLLSLFRHFPEVVR